MLHNHRLAAWVCILSAVLTVPSLLLTVAGAFLDSLLDTHVASIIPLLLECTLNALGIYILLALKQYLNATSINWVLWSLIGVSGLLLVFSLGMVIMPSVEILGTITGSVLIIPTGILYIVLGVKIRSIDTSAGISLRHFGMLSIVVGLMVLSIILMLAVPVISIIMDLLLASTFFKVANNGLTGQIPAAMDASNTLSGDTQQSRVEIQSSQQSQQENQQPTHDPDAELAEDLYNLRLSKTLVAIVALFVLVVSIALGGYQLLRLHELFEFSIRRQDDSIAMLLAISNVLKALLIVLLVKPKNLPNGLSLCLYAFVAVNILSFGHGIYGLAIASGDSGLSWLSPEFYTTKVFSYLLDLGIAIIYLLLGTQLQNSDHPLNGYKTAISIGCLASGATMLVYFIDTAILFSLMFVDMALLCLLLSALFSGSKFNLPETPFSQGGFIAVLLFGPMLFFVGNILWKLGNFASEESDWLMETGTALMEIEVTHMQDADSTAESIGAFRKIQAIGMFNNAWFLHDEKWLAVDNTALYETADGGEHWQRIKQLAYEGNSIQFDHTGQRGWIGDRWQGFEKTTDAGNTWQPVDPIAIYSSVMGKAYRNSIMGNQSKIHLDPATGHGGFTLKCRYFYTEDFAQTWSRSVILDTEGKELCANESAFAVNHDQNLALIGNALFFNLYRKNPTEGHWNQLCRLSDDWLGPEHCSTMETLTEEERKFAAHYDSDDTYFGDASFPNSRTLAAIIEDQYTPIDSLTPQPKQVGNTHWYSEEKNIVFTRDRGEQWEIVQAPRHFRHMVPVNLLRAYGWNSNGALHVTDNSGRTWQPYFAAKRFPEPSDIEYSDVSKMLWLLFSQQLVSVDARTGETREVLDTSNEVFDSIDMTPDGRILWLYKSDTAKATFSFDGGNSWHAIDTHAIALAQPLSRDHNGQRNGQNEGESSENFNENNVATWRVLNIHHISCAIGERRCYLLRGDRSIAELIWDGEKIEFNNEAFAHLAPLENAADFDPDYIGYIATRNRGQDIIHIAPYTRYVYTSNDKGHSWNKQSLKNEDEWRAPDFVLTGSLMVSGNSTVAISHDFGSSWTPVNPSDWADEMNSCWDYDGQTLFLFSTDNLALTTDGGKSWQRYEDDYDANPSCGIANGFLWLTHGEFAVFQRTPNAEAEQ